MISFSPFSARHFLNLMKSAMQTALSPFPSTFLSPHLSIIEILKSPLLCVYISIYQYLKAVCCVAGIAFFCALCIFPHFNYLTVGISVIPPFERGGVWGSEKLNNSSMASWLISGLTPKPTLRGSSG